MEIDLELKPVQYKKMYLIVVEKIIDLIKSEKIKKGDILPKQDSLARKLKVSRTTIREAFSALETMGIIETKVGRGSIILSDQIGVFAKLKIIKIPTIEVSPFDLFDVLPFWERRCAIVAAAKRDKSDIKDIDKMLKIVERQVKESGSFNIYDNLNYHKAIAKSTKNRLLIEVNNFVNEHVDLTFWQDLINNKYNNTTDFAKKDTEFCRKIFNAIVGKDGNKIRKLFNIRRNTVIKYIKSGLQGVKSIKARN